jgi:hypothetical protein
MMRYHFVLHQNVMRFEIIAAGDTQ